MTDFRLILSAIHQHITLSQTEQGILLSMLESKSVKSGEFLEKAGDPSLYFIFVNSGCLMVYYTDEEGVERVIQFATSSWWTGDLHSFTKCEPSIYSTRALADSEVFMITRPNLDNLLEQVPALEKYFRILFQNSLIAHQHRIVQTLSATAEERYETFRERYPSLEQYVPQKYIASYLGFTPEFLSKIRKRMTKRTS
jgi:CRP-like cAMP-binding protein